MDNEGDNCLLLTNTLYFYGIMNLAQEKILKLITDYLKEHPDQRFGQILFNMGINEFRQDKNEEFLLRDIYNDSDDEIVKRIENNIEYIQYQNIIKNKLLKNTFNLEGMTVNERLFANNLMDDFDFYINRNKKIARYILESIKIDEASIKKIVE